MRLYSTLGTLSVNTLKKYMARVNIICYLALCCRIFSEFRRVMTPCTLEMLVYLTANRDMWDIKRVHEAMQDSNFVEDRDDNELFEALDEEAVPDL